MRFHNANLSISNFVLTLPHIRFPVIVQRAVLDTVSPSKINSRWVISKRSEPFSTNRNTGMARSSVAAAMGEDDEEDDGLCPVDCVREFKTEDELRKVLEKATEDGSLVVVDFYRRSCGSCKYIEQGFSKLCKGSGDEEASVVFLKHDVLDEYDEQSELAELLKIKTVPLFHFYKNGVLLDSFATRDKEKITSAILKYASPV